MRTKTSYEATVKENIKRFKGDGFVKIRKGMNLATMQPSDNTTNNKIVDQNIRIYD